MPFHPQPPTQGPAAQDMVLSRGQPESSSPTACGRLVPDTPHGARSCGRAAAELEDWGLAGPHPCGPGGFGPTCQQSTVAMAAQSPARCVWPVYQLPGLNIR